jgi:hypothetical protein
MAQELPSNAPKEMREQPLAQKTALEINLLGQDVQVQAYTDMIKSIDARYPVDLGNVLKRNVKTEFAKNGQNALLRCKQTVDAFNSMWDKLAQQAEKLGVHANTQADRMVELLASNGIFNPEQTALIQILAIKNGINATLRGEYVAYINALKIQDILAKYNELTR